MINWAIALCLCATLLALPTRSQGKPNHIAVDKARFISETSLKSNKLKSLISVNQSETQIFVDVDEDGNWDHWEIKSPNLTITFDLQIGRRFTRATITKRLPDGVQTLRFALRQNGQYELNAATFREYNVLKYEFDDSTFERCDSPSTSTEAKAQDIIATVSTSEKEILSQQISSSSVVSPECKSANEATYRNIVGHLAKRLSFIEAENENFYSCLDEANFPLESLRLQADRLQISLNMPSSLITCEDPKGSLAPAWFDEKSTSMKFAIAKSHAASADKAKEMDHEWHHRTGVDLDSQIAIMKECCPIGVSSPTSTCKKGKLPTRTADTARFLRILLPIPSLFSFFQDALASQEGSYNELQREYFNALARAKRTHKETNKECASTQTPTETCLLKEAALVKIRMESFFRNSCPKAFSKAECTNYLTAYLKDFEESQAACTSGPQNKNCNVSSMVADAQVPTKTGDDSVVLPQEVAIVAEQFQSSRNPIAKNEYQAQHPELGPTVDFRKPEEVQKLVTKSRDQSSSIVRTAERISTWVTGVTGVSSIRSPSRAIRQPQTKKTASSNFSPTIDLKGSINSINTAARISDPDSEANSAQSNIGSNLRQPVRINPLSAEAPDLSTLSATRVASAATLDVSILGIPVSFGSKTADANPNSDSSDSGTSGYKGGSSRPATSHSTRKSKGRLNSGLPSTSSGSEQIQLDKDQVIRTLHSGFSGVQEYIEDPGRRAAFESMLIQERIRIRTPNNETIGSPTPCLRLTYKNFTSPPEERRTCK